MMCFAMMCLAKNAVAPSNRLLPGLPIVMGARAGQLLILPSAVLLSPCVSFQAVEYQPGYQEQEGNRHDDEQDSHTSEYVAASGRSKCRL